MRRILLGGIFTVIAVSSLAFGQIRDLELQSQMQEQFSLPPRTSGGNIPLESAINPDEYIIGPGDQFRFDIKGNIEVSQEFYVNPDGYILIPSVGGISVVGLTISEAEKQIEKLSKTVYRNAKCTFKLIKVRSMKVSISGAIRVPGVQEVYAVDRLSKLIVLAGGFYSHDEMSSQIRRGDLSRENNLEAFMAKGGDLREYKEAPPLPSKRRITILSKSGESRSVDFLMYERTGDLKYNPILLDGDQVHIPILESKSGVVQIFGAVKAPGEYEYVMGDRLMDIIDIAGGFTADALLKDVKIVRFEQNAIDRWEFEVDLNKLSDNDRGIELKPDDRIFIRRKPDYCEKHYVTVTGEVRYPGVYPIEADVTMLSEIIEACGGFTELANLASAGIERWAMAEIGDPEFDRLKSIPIADMTVMEYEYFKNQSREESPNVVVDFKKLFIDGDLSQDVTLQNKDEVTIPMLSPTVNVTGRVEKPGLIKFKPGASYSYYIDKAGGFSWNARKGKMRLIKARTGVWMELNKRTPIEIGDTIFIPEKTDFNYWELLKDTLLVLSQVATLIVVVRSFG